MLQAHRFAEPPSGLVIDELPEADDTSGVTAPWAYARAVRLLLRIGLAVAGNAIALLIAAALLDGFRINASGFLVAVIIFSIA